VRPDGTPAERFYPPLVTLLAMAVAALGLVAFRHLREVKRKQREKLRAVLGRSR